MHPTLALVHVLLVFILVPFVTYGQEEVEYQCKGRTITIAFLLWNRVNPPYRAINCVFTNDLTFYGPVHFENCEFHGTVLIRDVGKEAGRFATSPLDIIFRNATFPKSSGRLQLESLNLTFPGTRVLLEDFSSAFSPMKFQKMELAKESSFVMRNVKALATSFNYCSFDSSLLLMDQVRIATNSAFASAFHFTAGIIKNRANWTIIDSQITATSGASIVVADQTSGTTQIVGSRHNHDWPLLAEGSVLSVKNSALHGSRGVFISRVEWNRDVDGVPQNHLARRFATSSSVIEFVNTSLLCSGCRDIGRPGVTLITAESVTIRTDRTFFSTVSVITERLGGTASYVFLLDRDETSNSENVVAPWSIFDATIDFDEDTTAHFEPPLSSFLPSSGLNDQETETASTTPTARLVMYTPIEEFPGAYHMSMQVPRIGSDEEVLILSKKVYQKPTTVIKLGGLRVTGANSRLTVAPQSFKALTITGLHAANGATVEVVNTTNGHDGVSIEEVVLANSSSLCVGNLQVPVANQTTSTTVIFNRFNVSNGSAAVIEYVQAFRATVTDVDLETGSLIKLDGVDMDNILFEKLHVASGATLHITNATFKERIDDQDASTIKFLNSQFEGNGSMLCISNTNVQYMKAGIEFTTDNVVSGKLGDSNKGNVLMEFYSFQKGSHMQISNVTVAGYQKKWFSTFSIQTLHHQQVTRRVRFGGLKLFLRNVTYPEAARPHTLHVTLDKESVFCSDPVSMDSEFFVEGDGSSVAFLPSKFRVERLHGFYVKRVFFPKNSKRIEIERGYEFKANSIFLSDGQTLVLSGGGSSQLHLGKVTLRNKAALLVDNSNASPTALTGYVYLYLNDLVAERGSIVCIQHVDLVSINCVSCRFYDNSSFVGANFQTYTNAPLIVFSGTTLFDRSSLLLLSNISAATENTVLPRVILKGGNCLFHNQSKLVIENADISTLDINIDDDDGRQGFQVGSVAHIRNTYIFSALATTAAIRFENTPFSDFSGLCVVNTTMVKGSKSYSVGFYSSILSAGSPKLPDTDYYYRKTFTNHSIVHFKDSTVGEAGIMGLVYLDHVKIPGTPFEQKERYQAAFTNHSLLFLENTKCPGYVRLYLGEGSDDDASAIVGTGGGYVTDAATDENPSMYKFDGTRDSYFFQNRSVPDTEEIVYGSVVKQQNCVNNGQQICTPNRKFLTVAQSLAARICGQDLDSILKEQAWVFLSSSMEVGDPVVFNWDEVRGGSGGDPVEIESGVLDFFGTDETKPFLPLLVDLLSHRCDIRESKSGVREPPLVPRTHTASLKVTPSSTRLQNTTSSASPSKSPSLSSTNMPHSATHLPHRSTTLTPENIGVPLETPEPTPNVTQPPLTDVPSTPQPPSPPAVVSKSEVVISVVLPEEGAQTVSATGTTAALTSAIASPVAVSQTSRIGGALNTIDCVLTEDDPNPSYFEHPIRMSVGSGAMPSYTGSALATVLVFLLCPFVILCVLARIVSRSVAASDHRDVTRKSSTRTALKITAAIFSAFILYFCPSVTSSTVTVLFHTSDSTALAISFFCLAVSFVGVPISLFMLLRYDRFHASCTASSFSSGSSSTSTSSSESTRKEGSDESSESSDESSSDEHDSNENDGKNDRFAFKNKSPTSVYVEVLSPYFDATANTRKNTTRLYFVEDLVSANIISAIGGIRPATASSCGTMAGLLLLVSIAHAAYLIYFKPYRTKLDTFFVSLFALSQVLLAALCTYATSTASHDDQEGSVVSDETVLMIIGYLVIGQLAAFFVETVVQCYWAFQLQQRRKLLGDDDTKTIGGLDASLLIDQHANDENSDPDTTKQQNREPLLQVRTIPSGNNRHSDEEEDDDEEMQQINPLAH